MLKEKENFKSMMLMMAAMMPVEAIVSKIKEDLVKYEEAADSDKEDAIDALSVSCSLLLSKKIAPTMEAAMEMSKKSGFSSEMDIMTKNNNDNNNN